MDVPIDSSSVEGNFVSLRSHSTHISGPASSDSTVFHIYGLRLEASSRNYRIVYKDVSDNFV